MADEKLWQTRVKNGELMPCSAGAVIVVEYADGVYDLVALDRSVGVRGKSLQKLWPMFCAIAKEEENRRKVHEMLTHG